MAMIKPHTVKRPVKRKMLLLFLLLATGIVVAGFWYYHGYRRQYRDQIEHKLEAVATLKANEISQWRRERLEDGIDLTDNPLFASLAARGWITGSDPQARGDLIRWLTTTLRDGSYDQALLVAPGGATLLSLPAGRAPLSPAVRALLPGLFAGGRPQLSDFYRSPNDHRVHLNLLAPLRDPQHRPLAAVVLRIDPSRYLYPLIQSWPTESATAETVLTERDDANAVVLNELRFKNGTALQLRLPLTQTAYPIVQAVRGTTGITQGRDYTGKRVLIFIRKIPDTPWFILSKMDFMEVYGPLTRQLWWVGTAVLLLVIGAAVGTLILWRQQQNSYELGLQLTRQENSWLLDLITRSLNEVFVFDPLTLRFTFVNRGAQRNLGYTMDELALMTAFSIKPELDEERFRHLIKPLLADQEEMLIFETVHQRKDGSRYPVEVHLQLMQSGSERHFLAVITDISERKAYQEQLEAKNAELERFTYSMSHDLKSPLVTIKTFLGYLPEDIASGDRHRLDKDMEFMRSAADRMGLLLDELLELSRIGRVMQDSVVTPHDQLVQMALQMVAGRMEGMAVEFDLQPQTLALYGDRTRLVEIWQNLIENAVKYRGAADPLQIGIGLEQTGGETIFFVRDNGIGIDPRHRHKIFNLFDKLDPKSEGTGIGLALVKRIVELYQGRIWVESEGVGRGSCFRFTLPGALQKD